MDKTITRGGIRVEVGQQWRDLDKRMFGRTVIITAVDEAGFAHYKGSKKGRLSIKRMHNVSTGWELVQ